MEKDLKFSIDRDDWSKTKVVMCKNLRKTRSLEYYFIQRPNIRDFYWKEKKEGLRVWMLEG